MPPLCQTRAYTEALQASQAVAVGETSSYCPTLREATLTSAAVNVHLVMAEAVLRRLVGGAKVMADQLTWILQLIGLPGVTVQVVPDGVGAYPGIGTSFTIMTFIEKHLDDVVFTQALHRATWLEAADDRVPYEKTFAKLLKVALPRPESAELVAASLLQFQ